MTLAYMAHPVSGNVGANVERALRWLKWLQDREPDTTYIAPWIAALLAGADDSDPVQRVRGLAHDCRVVARCDALVLVGGRESAGMAIERNAMLKAGGRVIDLTHLGEEPPDV